MFIKIKFKNINYKNLSVQKAYNTRDSQDVSDPSTNRAQRCLTCQIGRDGVFSARYGRKRVRWEKLRILDWKIMIRWQMIFKLVKLCTLNVLKISLIKCNDLCNY